MTKRSSFLSLAVLVLASCVPAEGAPDASDASGAGGSPMEAKAVHTDASVPSTRPSPIPSPALQPGVSLPPRTVRDCVSRNDALPEGVHCWIVVSICTQLGYASLACLDTCDPDALPLFLAEGQHLPDEGCYGTP